MMARTCGRYPSDRSQVRHQPHEAVQIGTGTIGGHLTSLKTLLDGILVRTGEGGEHEIAGIRVTLGNLQLVAVLNVLRISGTLE